MLLVAGCCEFLVYLLVTDKAVQLQPDFRGCSRDHGSSAAFFAVDSAHVTILRKNPTDASVIPLLV